MRLDVYLAQRGMAKSRTSALALISEGAVSVNGRTVTKASFSVTEDDAVVIEDPRSDTSRYVSRGGLKLEAALERFGIDTRGMVCADIGASTGGFTDCLLKHGASKVYAVDSGSGQLAEGLRKDSRVISLEGVNARYMTPDTIGEKCSVVTCDVSFISQTFIIPRAALLLKDGGIYIGLVKPQFEAGREAVGKKGIVKDPRHHESAVRKVAASLEENGLSITGLMRSPVKGGDGNTEFLFAAVKKNTDGKEELSCLSEMITKVLQAAETAEDAE